MTLNKSFFVGVFNSARSAPSVFTEIFLRVTVPAGFWYRHFDLSGDMTSLAEIRDRLSFAAPPDHRVLLLGDSVLGASALMEHDISQARLQALSIRLKQNLRASGVKAISLGSDGLLLPDIEGLTSEFLGHPPEKILLLLNFRMFSKEFGEGPKALSAETSSCRICPTNCEKGWSPTSRRPRKPISATGFTPACATTGFFSAKPKC